MNMYSFLKKITPLKPRLATIINLRLPMLKTIYI